MGLWEELLGPAALGGVELPVVRRRITGGRDFARKRLPFVAGQEVEDTGRRPREIEVQAELFNDMDEDDLYPDRYEELVAVLDDDSEQTEVLWDDPVWGPIPVKVVRWTAVEEAQSRDGVQITLNMEERGFSTSSDAVFSLLQQSDEGRAETDGAEFDALMEELAIGDDEIEAAWEESGFKKKELETVSFQDQVNNLVNDLDAGLQRADQVIAKVNTVQARVESVMALPAARTAAAWQVIDKGTRLIDSVAAIGESVVSRQTRIINFTTTGRTSVYEIAAKLYGDVDRVSEILRANPQESPLFIPAGTVLRVLEK